MNRLTSKLRLACWNVSTMQDSDSKKQRPQRRPALVAKELAKVDIAAFSEVRFHEEGSLSEHGAGYTIYWSGKARNDHRLLGVGFMIKRLQTVLCLFVDLNNEQYVTIISFCDLTLQTDYVAKETLR